MKNAVQNGEKLVAVATSIVKRFIVFPTTTTTQAITPSTTTGVATTASKTTYTITAASTTTAQT